MARVRRGPLLARAPLEQLVHHAPACVPPGEAVEVVGRVALVAGAVPVPPLLHARPSREPRGEPEHPLDVEAIAAALVQRQRGVGHRPHRRRSSLDRRGELGVRERTLGRAGAGVAAGGSTERRPPRRGCSGVARRPRPDRDANRTNVGDHPVGERRRVERHLLFRSRPPECAEDRGDERIGGLRVVGDLVQVEGAAQDQAPLRAGHRDVQDPPLLLAIALDRALLELSGKPLHRSGPPVEIPHQSALKYSDVTAGDERWRVFRARDAQHAIQISQRWSAREEVAAHAAMGAAAPLIAVIPLAWLLIGWAVGRVLAGLGTLSADISQRSVDAKDAIGMAVFRPRSPR